MTQEKPSPKTENKAQKPKEAQNREKSAPEGPLEEKGGFENRAEPTRYGDWEVNGRCTDF